MRNPALLPARVNFFRRVLLVLAVGVGLRLFAEEVAADSPVPTADALAEKLCAAPDDAARRRLLADAPADLARSEEARRAYHQAIGPVIYAGDYARAEALLRFDCAWSEENGDRRGLALVEWSLATIEGARGDNRAALGRFEACTQFFDDLGDKERVAGATQCLGIVHQQLGDYRLALGELQRAQALYKELGNREGIINTTNSIGAVFNDQAMSDQAEKYWQAALELAGDDEGWQMLLNENLANVDSARGDYRRAAERLRLSISLAEKLGEKPREAICHDALGDVWFKDDRWDEAEAEYRRALILGEEMDDKRRVFSTVASLAELGWQRGPAHWPQALALAERASALARETGEAAHLWEGNTITGKLCRALGDPARARAALEAAINVIEDTRGRLSVGDEGAVVYLDDKIEPYQEMIGLLVEQGRTREALDMAERAKARVLVEVLRSARGDPQGVVTAPERERVKALGQEVAALNRQIAANREPKDAASLEEKLRQARRDRDAAESDVIAGHPELRHRTALTNTSQSATDLAGLLGDGTTALLEYAVTDRETFLFVVRRDKEASAPEPDVQVFRLPLARAELSRRTAAFRRLLASRDLDWRGAADRLGADLLAASHAAWADARNMVIVPDGVLWEMPFQVLPVREAAADAKAPAPLLLERATVAFAPSMTFLTHARAAVGRPRPPASTRQLAMGAPAPDDKGAADASAGLLNEERQLLPDADRQLRALGQLYGPDDSRVLTGQDAREATFKRLAGDYDILHLATHGSYNDGAPLYSRLLLSRRDLAPDEDGFLEAWELLAMKLRARLTVLAACETGRGRVGAGEGVFGLTWALLMAGCPQVVVSQWKVDGAGTTDLMLGFHRRLREGQAPAHALREASLELMKNPAYRHPFYWAPFVAVGAAVADD